MEEYPRVIYGKTSGGAPTAVKVETDGTVSTPPSSPAIQTSDWKTAQVIAGMTYSPECDLEDEYSHLEVIFPATLDNTVVKVQVTRETGGTMQDLVGAESSSTTGGITHVWFIGLWRYFRIVTSATQTDFRDFLCRGVKGV
jgi:hypothetical protein